MKKVYYVGDWAILTGPVFAETPFHHSPKGLEIFNYGIWLKEALEKDPAIVIKNISAGKVIVYTSDPCPHWGCNFVFWEGYPAFWQSLAKLVLS